jgi:hypothetical protein
MHSLEQYRALEKASGFTKSDVDDQGSRISCAVTDVRAGQPRTR